MANKPKLIFKIINSSKNNYCIQINDKIAKTPNGNLIELPTLKLAKIILKDFQSKKSKMLANIVSPVRITNTAIDKLVTSNYAYIEQLSAYLNSDVVCYFSYSPKDLVKKQNKNWLPMIKFMQDEYNINILYTSEILAISQPKASLAKLKKILKSKNCFELSAIGVLVQLTNSIIISLALVNDKINAKDAYEISNLEEIYQSSFWGKDEEAFTRLKAISIDIKNVKKYFEAIKE
jgi:chaperone required for assembly of F1-ATPase